MKQRVSVTIRPANHLRGLRWDKCQRSRHNCNHVLLFHVTDSMSHTQEQYLLFLNNYFIVNNNNSHPRLKTWLLVTQFSWASLIVFAKLALGLLSSHNLF